MNNLEANSAATQELAQLVKDQSDTLRKMQDNLVESQGELEKVKGELEEVKDKLEEVKDELEEMQDDLRGMKGLYDELSLRMEATRCHCGCREEEGEELDFIYVDTLLEGFGESAVVLDDDGYFNPPATFAAESCFEMDQISGVRSGQV